MAFLRNAGPNPELGPTECVISQRCWLCSVKDHERSNHQDISLTSGRCDVDGFAVRNQLGRFGASRILSRAKRDLTPAQRAKLVSKRNAA
jgi:hypothetical protein